MREPVRRPGLLEISSILLACAVLLLGLNHLDRQGRERVMKRAEQVTRTQAAAKAPAARPAPESKPVVASTRSGERGPGPILLLLMGGAGLSMAGAGLRLLSRRSA